MNMNMNINNGPFHKEEAKTNKVFLGGTCNHSNWRDELISKLKIEYFNPVVPDWNEEAYQEELHQRQVCSFCLYVITPLMEGVYSIAEIVDDSNKRPDKTIFCFVDRDCSGMPPSVIDNDECLKFSEHQLKSLRSVGRMVEKNGAKWLKSLDEVAEFLNKA